ESVTTKKTTCPTNSTPIFSSLCRTRSRLSNPSCTTHTTRCRSRSGRIRIRRKPILPPRSSRAFFPESGRISREQHRSQVRRQVRLQAQINEVSGRLINFRKLRHRLRIVARDVCRRTEHGERRPRFY